MTVSILHWRFFLYSSDSQLLEGSRYLFHLQWWYAMSKHIKVHQWIHCLNVQQEADFCKITTEPQKNNEKEKPQLINCLFSNLHTMAKPLCHLSSILLFILFSLLSLQKSHSEICLANSCYLAERPVIMSKCLVLLINSCNYRGESWVAVCGNHSWTSLVHLHRLLLSLAH